MFLLDRDEHREPGHLLADYLPWAELLGDSVIQLKTGALMRTLCFRGPDADMLSASEHAARAHAIAATLGCVCASGWALHVEMAREESTGYISARHGHPVVKLIDGVRQARFYEESALFTNAYYLTLTWTPATPVGARLLARVLDALGGLFQGGEEVEDEVAQMVEARDYFMRATRQFFDLFSSLFVEAAWLEREALLGYLHSTVSPNHHAIRTPLGRMYLDGLLGDVCVSLGLEGKLGAHHMRVVSIKSYPVYTSPHALSRLSTLPFPLRFVSRFIALSSVEAQRELAKYQNLFYARQKQLAPALFGEERLDEASLKAAGDIGALLGKVAGGERHAGYHSCQVVVWDTDHGRCERRAEEVLKVMREEGYGCVDETAGLRRAWLSSLPGNVWANPRRAGLTTVNLAHLIPSCATWGGRERSDHVGHAPHVYAIARGSAPFRLNLNVRDVGHTFILGPTGYGKSTLLGLLMAQWLKYKGAQVFCFDKGRSARCLTLCLEGAYLELDPSKPGAMAFAPLSQCTDPGERAFLLDWLEEIIVLEGHGVSASERAALAHGLDAVATAPRSHHTLGGLWEQLQNTHLKIALEPYTERGTFGAMFGNMDEALTLHQMTTFEMGPLFELPPRLIAITLRYLFRRIEARFDGRPTLLVLDEAWLFLDNPIFAPRIRTWLKTLRKHNVYVVFASQEVAEVIESPIVSSIIANCPTQILLSNPKASSPALAPAYAMLGLSEQEISQITTGRRYHYLFSNVEGSRMFELGLTPLELNLVATSSPEAQTLIDAVLTARERDGSERPFYKDYLQTCGFGHLVDR